MKQLIRRVNTSPNLRTLFLTRLLLLRCLQHQPGGSTLASVLLSRRPKARSGYQPDAAALAIDTHALARLDSRFLRQGIGEQL